MLAPLLALLDRDSLLGVGVSLVVAGVVLRGFARSQRRSAALRRQHDLHERPLGTTASTPSASDRLGHFERHLGRYAAAALVVGLITVVAGFVRH